MISAAAAIFGASSGVFCTSPPSTRTAAREFSADHIARLYLTRLLGNLELNADTVVTFTAPVNAFDTYREWISAFFAENYPDVPYRLVDESVAAAISYGSTRAGSVVCVVDFGGGTLDVSVVRMPESFAGAAAGEAAKGRVLGKAGRLPRRR